MQLRVRLVDGEWRTLVGDYDDPEKAFKAFLYKHAPHTGEWLETTDFTYVSRAHVIEYSVV